MSDSSDDQAVDRADTDGGAEADRGVDADVEADTDAESAAEAGGPSDSTTADDLDALREQVDAEYDFENFTPADMAKMSAEEWEAAFDAETWITGPELLDRLEKDLKTRSPAVTSSAWSNAKPSTASTACWCTPMKGT
jgi:hypothetical protein